MNKNSTDIKITRTEKNKGRLITLLLVYLVMTIVFLSLSIWVSFTELKLLLLVFVPFLSLSVSLLSYVSFLIDKYDNDTRLPVEVIDNVLKFKNHPKIALANVKSFVAKPTYEKPMLRFIIPNIGKRSFGTIVITKKDKSKIKLYFVEDVEHTVELLNKQLAEIK